MYLSVFCFMGSYKIIKAHYRWFFWVVGLGNSQGSWVAPYFYVFSRLTCTNRISLSFQFFVLIIMCHTALPDMFCRFSVLLAVITRQKHTTDGSSGWLDLAILLVVGCSMSYDIIRDAFFLGWPQIWSKKSNYIQFFFIFNSDLISLWFYLF